MENTMTERRSMGKRFNYVKYDATATDKQERLKELFEQIEVQVELALPDSRAKSLLLTHLEEAYMWSGKAIRDEQITRNIQTEHVPERSNE